MAHAILHDKEQRKFYTLIDGHEAYLLYRLVGTNQLEFYSTYVPSVARGLGLAQQLVEAGIALAELEKKKVLPTCSYVVDFFAKYPEKVAKVQLK